MGLDPGWRLGSWVLGEAWVLGLGARQLCTHPCVHTVSGACGGPVEYVLTRECSDDDQHILLTDARGAVFLETKNVLLAIAVSGVQF